MLKFIMFKQHSSAGGYKLTVNLHMGCALPAHKAVDVVVAVVDLEEVGQAGRVLLQVELQELQVDPVPVADPDVPVAHLLVLVLVRVARRLENVFGIREDPATLFS